MVFCNRFAQKICFPDTFGRIIVYRPVHTATLIVVMPVLLTLGRKNRMFYRKNKHAPGRKALMNFLTDAAEICKVVKGQGADHHIESTFWKIKVLYCHAVIGDTGKVIDPSGFFQHFFRQVYSPYRSGPLLHGITAVPAKATTQIKHPFPFKSGQHFLKYMPFSCPFQSFN
ncbi:hypothetical protein D3C86_1533220 [compost metagenome]